MSLFEIATAVTSAPPASPEPQLGVIALAGSCVAFFFLVCWMYARDVTSCAGVIGVFLAWVSVYTFIVGAWPVGLLAGLWAVAALWVWRQLTGDPRKQKDSGRQMKLKNHWNEKSRFEQMFGSNSVN